MDAETISLALAERFLSDGAYTSAGTSYSTNLAPAGARQVLDARMPEQDFAGLAVQSVGYSLGSPSPYVQIFVSKGSKKALAKLDREVDGIQVRVRNIGKLVVRPGAGARATHRGQLYERGGRIACGSSCCPSDTGGAGTLGALVRRGTEMYMMSNNHVIGACNHTPIGMPILSPATMDSHAAGRSPGEVARHAEIVPLRSGRPELVDPCMEDLAIALIRDESKVSSWQGDDDEGYDTPSAVEAPVSGMKVKKAGRTTGVTNGEVDVFVNTPTPVPYESRYFTGIVWVTGVWTVRSADGDHFTAPGDSGSLVVTEDGSAAVGVIFAGAGGDGWMIPMPHVITHFRGISLVNNHGV